MDQGNEIPRPSLTLIARVRAAIRADRATQIRRRKALAAAISLKIPALIRLLFFIGYGWILAIPSPFLGQRTYIDENALQPGQVNTYWNWGDVHAADVYLGQLEALRDRNATSDERAKFLATEFQKLGLSASTQSYAFTTRDEVINGTNAYAVHSSPRTSGTEAMLISASWLSRTGEGDGTLNLRGVSTVLALAGFLKRYSMWAKDIIFVVSDGYLDGMHAWLNAYHSSSQSNLNSEALSLTSGVIWTALNIDYSGHSFSHLGVFFEGLNGRLPNQDLINSFHIISRQQNTGNVPVVVYDHLDPRDYSDRQDELYMIPSWFPTIVKENPDVKEYSYRARNIGRHVGYQARGKASGVHGLLHQFRIDAITLFAIPASGPHGFYDLGRIVESTLRTMNNLLERLHASFFFYILAGPSTFLKIGSYLPSAVLISVAMMFAGLKEWTNAGSVFTAEDDPEAEKNEQGEEIPPVSKWITRRRRVLPAIAIAIATHVLGGVLFFLLTRSWVSPQLLAWILPTLVAVSPILWLSSTPSMHLTIAPLSLLLKSINLCLASTVISITSVLNFSLAAGLAVVLGIPLCYSTPSWSLNWSYQGMTFRIPMYGLYIVLAFGWLFQWEAVKQTIWDWEVLGVWFAPFVCIVYVPLVLQAAIVATLPPDLAK